MSHGTFRRALLIFFIIVICPGAAYAADKPKAPHAQAAPPKPGKGTAEDLYKEGVSLGMNGKFKESIEKFRKATEVDPRYAPAYSGWGLSLSNMGQDGPALEKYKKAVEVDPKLAKAYYSWGLALARLKRYDEATEKLKSAAKLDATRANEINELIQKVQKQKAASKEKPAPRKSR